MLWRARIACLGFVALVGGCSSFTGKEQDGGASSDMATPSDMAVSDAGVAVFSPVYAPTPCATQTGLYAIGADGEPIDLGDASVASETAPDEPYCTCSVSGFGPAGVRWATCQRRESIQDCFERTGGGCDEYGGPERALGCSFASVSSVPGDLTTTPSCAPMQYSLSPCATCEEGVCIVYADGFTECVPATPEPLPSRGGQPACFAVPGQQRFQAGRTPDAIESPPRTSCEPRADCAFLANGDATCALAAPQVHRYPRRGCGALAGGATTCTVRVSPSDVATYDLRSGAPRSCTVTRSSDAVSWENMTLEWAPYRNPAVEVTSCTTSSLCDLTDNAVATCIAPEWTILPPAMGGICSQCVGVPCFVYEDGSDECNTIPTRTGAGLENGYCVVEDGSVQAVRCGDGESTACANYRIPLPLEGGVRCIFDAEGLPEVTPL